MRFLQQILVCFSLVLIFLSSTFGQTHVSGIVSGVWGPEGNPYIADSTLLVPNDSTLEILPGVEVFFTARQNLNVNGKLIAVGTESDSIHFHWSGCSSSTFMEGIHLEYSDTCLFSFCVIDTPRYPILAEYSAVKIENCTFSAWNEISIRYSSYCLITQSDIWADNLPILIYDYSTAEIRDNRFDDASASGGGIAVVMGCYVDILNNECTGGIGDFYHSSGTVIGNKMNHLSVNFANGPVLVENNEIFRDSFGASGDVSITVSDGVEFRNNTVYHLVVRSWDYPCSWLIEKNEIYESVEVEDEFAFAEFRNNLILDGVEVTHDASADLINNTIYMVNNNIGIDANTIWGEGELGDIRNNIILGYGIDGVGINGTGSGIIEYNCIWGFETPWTNIASASNNLLEDPLLAGGDPFEYTLQANSPCIDAGDPASPLDPDFTRKDMGAYFYNQNMDNPPVISSTPDTIATTNTLFRYVATATDDYGPLTFSFLNLPQWLNEEYQRDWVADSVVLSGIVPQDQDDFSFLITVEDGIGQADSQWVDVEITDATQIQGIVTGVLPLSGSPYVMLDNVIIPEGESLTIEPGVVIRVKRCPHFEGLYAIKVYGQILAQGTEEDSIIFTSDEAEPEYDWNGIQFIHCNSDTSVISYSILKYGYYGVVKADSSSALIIHNNLVRNNFMGLMLSNNSTGLIHSNYFEYNEYYCITCNSSSPEIFNNHFADTCYYSVSIVMYSSNGFIHDNFFTGNYGINVNYSSYPLINGNVFHNLQGSGFSILNGSGPTVVNNTIIGCGNGIKLYSNITPSIKNNIISGCMNYGIKGNFLGVPPDTLDIRYNDIWGNLEGNFVDCPDYLGIPDTINANGDSCDIFFNISVDPLFIGGEPFDYNLALGSHCIDAGVDVGFPYFGDAPDIGAYESNYAYVDDANSAIPGEFYLRQNYPNPFNPMTTITYDIPELSDVQLIVYDLMGREVVTLVNKQVKGGTYQAIWDGKDQDGKIVSSGVYIYLLTARSKESNRLFNQTNKLVLLK